jgi:hypothetical protein
MHAHRKLLVLGLNELLAQNLVSLTDEGDSQGHLMAKIAGEDAVLLWQTIGSEEIRISVWWKFDYSKHPQAQLVGAYKERFSGASPLAKSQHYPKFVGATVSGWLERKTGKYLMGRHSQGLFGTYLRRGEREVLDAIPVPVPNGFKVEGKFFA